MPLCCPHCNAWLPEVKDAICPQCRGDLNNPPSNFKEVPDKLTVAENSFEHVVVAIVLLLVMVGFAFAFVQSLEDENTALSVVFGVVILGCAAVLSVIIRQLIGWLRARSR